MGQVGSPFWLLVGNSRWHWAEATEAGLRIHHQSAVEALAVPPPDRLVAWAAVGRVPATLTLPADRRVVTAAVPLAGLPPWLGVDRALAGWLAWRRQRQRQAVLVADAGTVLSLTCIDREGGFGGGRLLAGLGLQLRAMAEATAALPSPPAPAALAALVAGGNWPIATEAAMAVGVTQGLAAALAAAVRERRLLDPACRLVLTGGDGDSLIGPLQALLGEAEGGPVLEEDLALRALVALRPVGGVQASPRSVST